ncbi:hypothetical protein CHKEEEPN_0527 [Methylorubrum podarium]|nr:hypothetical protein CHKEEEPN_0527 [Methylorubrum podarium]
MRSDTPGAVVVSSEAASATLPAPGTLTDAWRASAPDAWSWSVSAPLTVIPFATVIGAFAAIVCTPNRPLVETVRSMVKPAPVAMKLRPAVSAMALLAAVLLPAAALAAATREGPAEDSTVSPTVPDSVLP